MLETCNTNTKQCCSTDDSKPFSWSGAGQQLFGASADGDDSHHDGDDVAQGDDPHFEPIIELPDLVEVKSGISNLFST